MARKPSAIVIGAGIGGIATAGRLVRQGYEVTVVEKNSHAGGRCDQIVKDGHRFDVGPTLFLMPDVVEETYASLGEKMSDHLDLKRIDPTYTVRFDDGTRLALTSNIGAMQAQLEAIEPGAFGGFLRYLSEGQLHYRLSLEKFVGRNFYSYFDYFSPGNLPLLFKLKALVKHYDNVGHYFKNPHLKAAFTFQNMYLGLSPYDAPATYSLLQYTELAEGVWFPTGGMYRLIETLTGIAEKNGARFIYNAPVERIEQAGKRATGIVLEDGRKLEADVIVVNADLPYAYRELLCDEAEARKLDRKKFTCSAIMFYWGVDKVYPQIKVHNVWLAGDYKSSFDRIFEENTLPDQPSFYVHAPTRTDPAAAPEGQDSLMVLVPVGHLDESRPQDWAALKDRARSAVLARLKEIGAHDLDQHIKFEVCYTPKNWQTLYNLEKGAAFGLSHNFMQVGYLRPRNRHAHLHNVYFAGASTHPGTGVPIVLLSARLTAERILKDAGRRQPSFQLKPVAA